MSNIGTIKLTLFSGELGGKTFETNEIKSYRGGDYYSVIELKDGRVFYVNETYTEINKQLKFYKNGGK